MLAILCIVSVILAILFAVLLKGELDERGELISACIFFGGIVVGIPFTHLALKIRRNRGIGWGEPLQ